MNNARKRSGLIIARWNGRWYAYLAGYFLDGVPYPTREAALSAYRGTWSVDV